MRRSFVPPGRAVPFLAIGVLIGLAGFARAADGTGHYAVDGIGRTPCSAFTKAATSGASAEVANYAGWLGGFVTAYNVFTPDTYDVTPWQTTELLMGKLQRHCTEFPDKPFIEAIGGLLATLAPNRLATESPLVSLRAHGQSVFLPAAMLAPIARALTAAGYPVETAEGTFDAPFAQALAQFQSAKGIPTSGLPDQATLNALFP